MSENFHPDRRHPDRKDEKSDRRRFLRPTGQLKKRGAVIALAAFAVLGACVYIFCC